MHIFWSSNSADSFSVHTFWEYFFFLYFKSSNGICIVCIFDSRYSNGKKHAFICHSAIEYHRPIEYNELFAIWKATQLRFFFLTLLIIIICFKMERKKDSFTHMLSFFSVEILFEQWPSYAVPEIIVFRTTHKLNAPKNRP